MQKYSILLFYKFVKLPNPEAVAEWQRSLCRELGLTGRVIIAEEGINATLEGTVEATTAYKAAMKESEYFSDMSFKESEGTGSAFPKLSVKVRPEIVTLKAGTFDPSKETAPELTAEELQRWYEDNEDFVVLDLRNSYEIQSGQFERTIDPGLDVFRDLGEKLEAIRSNPELENKKVVTVCTGGIRCEKATCLLQREGFENVYQLKDGIHTYMEKYPGQHFKGTLYVFDNRKVTDVVAAPGKEVIGQCFYCEAATEHYVDDDSVKPSRQILCCEACYNQRAETLRDPHITAA